MVSDYVAGELCSCDSLGNFGDPTAYPKGYFRSRRRLAVNASGLGPWVFHPGESGRTG